MMGRSSQEQARQTRRSIVESASGLFRSRGVDGVSVADVMREIGMTVGGFYKHFQSKDELIREAFTLSFAQASESWGEVAKRAEREPEPTTAIIRHYFQNRPLDQTCPMLAFAPHAADGDSDPQSVSAYQQGTEALFKRFADHMRALAPDPDAVPDQQVKVLFAAMIGAGFLARSMGDAEWLRSMQSAIGGFGRPSAEAREAELA